MDAGLYENLKSIRFAGELLPKWAQLLDLAARLCRLPTEACQWFSGVTFRAGMEDSKTVLEHCGNLKRRLLEQRESVLRELRDTDDDSQAQLIVSAWTYALDTMIQQAGAAKTCAWTVDGADEGLPDDSSGGDVTLRRV